jgi:two-component system nitrate/nitrite response regulator NarL
VRRCLLADDHPALAVAVSDFLEANGYDVVARAADGSTAVELAATEQPEVAIVDYRMPGLAGRELVARLRDTFGGPVLVYTADASDGDVRRLLEHGASGVVLKESPLHDLIRALRAVENGTLYIDPVLGARTLSRTGERPALTEREREALVLLGEGRSHEEIGRVLSIGVETVRTHLRKATDKLGAANRTQAVATALRLGLIE